MSRTRKSLKNIKFAAVGQAAALIISFFSRMVFVQTLSSEYLGLNGLFSNILSILSFAELGVGAAIVYSLYKPLADQDTTKIKALMRLYKQFYITIGIVIATLGAAITPFLPFLVKDMPDIPYINLIYLMFVANSSLSYFFSYKRSLIIADQKRYIATFYQYSFFVTLNIVQIIVLLITKNYLLFLSTQLLFTFLENYFVSKKANQMYPYIKQKITERIDSETKKTIVRNVKAMMSHKIGGIVVNGTDSLLISKFVGIISVGIYSNYLLITSALNTIFRMFFQATTASIGNLGVTESKEKSHFIFSCIDLVGFWMYGFATIALLNLINPFIGIWLGDEYLFPITIVLIIIINFYLNGMRKSVLAFREALGLYWYDRYKPLFEVVINLISSIILAKNFGIAGIFIGTMISTLTTCFWVEPYILFKYGFERSVKSYFIKYFTYTITVIFGGLVTWFICNYIDGSTLLNFTYKLIICAIVPNVLFIIVFWKTAEFKYLLTILKSILKNRIS